MFWEVFCAVLSASLVHLQSSAQSCTMSQGLCVGTEVFSSNQTILPVQLSAETTKVLFFTSQIHTISKGAFMNTMQLERVEFIGTPTANIEDGAFQSLSRLKVLEISSTNVTLLPPDAFKDLSKLEVLVLKQNKITSITKELFDGLRNLRELQLQHNSIGSIPEGTFNGLESLQMLNLSRNKLTSLQASLLSGLRRLQIFSVSGNQLQTLPEEIWGGELTNLEEINAQGNKIRVLPPDGHNLKLEKLFLDSNHLSKVEEDMFAGFPSLKTLSLQSNGLSHLNPRVFNKLTQLRDLNLSHNRLANVSVSGLGNLTSLNLENNRIRSLEVTNLPSLHTLRLADNVLTTISGAAWDQMPNLGALSLGGNAWHCDCSLMPVVTRVLRFTVTDRPTCDSPQRLKDEDVLTQTEEMLCPAGRDPTQSTGDSIAVTSRKNISSSENNTQAEGDASFTGTSSENNSSTETNVQQNWSSFSQVILATVFPVFILIFIVILLKQCTQSRGYAVRPVDPSLKCADLITEENCRLLHVHELQYADLLTEGPTKV
ncbi:leucine-rich repeat-containing protein 15-like [Denticeps clupeoides]|uniref:leucine-rich repeat-containing protein 15-like n=1 Tax=Denticeps clupeoides TaxID=299321 RepID=UPI0010A5225A|nr:leucine-rich repeat-containing protein 15-like [Denticeps clupeoides]